MENTKASKYRKSIATKLQSLRKKRGFTQADLAQRLGLGQGTYSRVENGHGSLSAEQFLEVLRIFNVPASEFEAPENLGSDIQNALIRLGANHLLGDGSRLPDERLNRVEEVFREVLADGTQGRHLTALAPVFVRNHKDIQLKKLWSQFVAFGLEARLGWALENIREALRLALQGGSLWQRAAPLRAAERSLEPFLVWVEEQRPRIISNGANDLLGVRSLSLKSRNDVLASSSVISRRWGIITRLVPEEFLEALKAADVTY